MISSDTKRHQFIDNSGPSCSQHGRMRVAKSWFENVLLLLLLRDILDNYEISFNTQLKTTLPCWLCLVRFFVFRFQVLGGCSWRVQRPRRYSSATVEILLWKIKENGRHVPLLVCYTWWWLKKLVTLLLAEFFLGFCAWEKRSEWSKVTSFLGVRAHAPWAFFKMNVRWDPI